MPVLYLFAIVFLALFFSLLSLGGGLGATIFAFLAVLGIALIFLEVRNRKLDAEVAAASQPKLLPLAKRKFDDHLPPGDELFLEIDRVDLYEARPSCFSGYSSASPRGRSGPAELRAGGICYWDPDFFFRVDRGRLMATSNRLIFQGRSGRREWQWTRVGEICYDHAGLLITRRHGRPRGLGLRKPDPRLFAFIKAQLAV